MTTGILSATALKFSASFRCAEEAFRGKVQRRSGERERRLKGREEGGRLEQRH
jgi:hypothetical protein